MVLSFGELLLRFAPDAESEWLNRNAIDVYTGGSELNVAVALAKWKIPVSYCTVLPKNFLSAQVVRSIKEYNIDTSTIIYNGNKTGLYFLLKETQIKDAEIIYDKTRSSFSELKQGMIDWNSAFNGIRWFHFSAASVALNKNVAAVCKEALEICIKKGITVSVDLNHRSKLLQHGKKAAEIMPDLLQYCDIVTGDMWSAESALNIRVPDDIHSINSKENYMQQAKKTSEEIMKQFSRCKIVAYNFRLHKNSIECFGTFFTNNNLYVSASYRTNEAINKVGSSDCFTAGLIYSIYNHLPFQQIINFATAAAFQKLFIKDDFTDKTSDEVKLFIQQYV